MMAAEGEATILVVDDDPVVRRLVKKGVQAGGFGEVLEAEDGEDAVALLREREVDLVVTDLLMPRLDGLGLIRWAIENAPGPRWIILSGVETFDVAVEAVRLGAFEFLSKPVHIRQLQVAVRNALGQRQLERDRERLFKELEDSHRRLIEKVRELEDKSEVIRRDLQRAEVIQRALLPKEPPRLDGFSLQTFYRPGRYVGGDLYNVVRVTDRHVALYVADATGHGVSSAMLSVLFDRKLVLSDQHSAQPLSPARVLASVNRSICEERIAPGLFLTAAYCLLDTVGGQAVIALAGHPPAFLRRAQGELQAFPRTGPALGLTTTASYAEEWFSLEAGDRLLLYTDGLLEGARGGAAGRAWLEDALTRGNGNAREVVELLGGTTSQHNSEDEDRDDVTVLLLDAHPGVSRFDNGESPRGRPKQAAAPVPKAPVVYYGESADTSFIAFRGRATWVHCDVFGESVAGLLDEGRTVVIELRDCEHMDSTALGTLHELVARANRGRGSLRLQGVTDPVRRLFDELSMSDVVHAIREPTTLPRDMEPVTPLEEPQGSQWRILRAHETLASLSARNHERFLAVVETIRSQIE